jgi:hypothetical protein
MGKGVKFISIVLIRLHDILLLKSRLKVLYVDKLLIYY